MHKVRSAKQLTILYFSIVAFAIIAIHATVLESTLERIEQVSVKNRLLLQKENIIARYHASETKSKVKIDQFTTVYGSRDDLPFHIDKNVKLLENEAFELEKNTEIKTEYFLMKYAVNGAKDGYIYAVQQDLAFELGEDEVLMTQSSQTLTSLVLLIISLLVVMRISDRLTSPISLLAKQISDRDPSDMSKVSIPNGIATKELLQLVDNFNHNQEQIKALLERERSFNRLASHELRTPLMVMKGATSLLSHSNEPTFITKQQSRLAKAANEMNDFIETLLSLTKSEKFQATAARKIELDEIDQIAESHLHLIEDKPIAFDLNVIELPTVYMPEAGFKILLGNLLKNAFAYTDEGSITVSIDKNKIEVIDTGIGIAPEPRGNEGYGLGLLIAKDICRKYEWQFSLENNIHNGCTASLRF